MSIKYYQLAKDEELPDEFCAVRDIGGEPSEYTFYVPESENTELRMRITSLEEALEGMHLIREQDKNENAKLRSICAEVSGILFNLDVDHCGLCDRDSINHPCPVHTVKGGECLIERELRELGVD